MRCVSFPLNGELNAISESKLPPSSIAEVEEEATEKDELKLWKCGLLGLGVFGGIFFISFRGRPYDAPHNRWSCWSWSWPRRAEKSKKKTLKETYTLEVTSERFTKLITSLKTAEEERHLFWGSNKKNEAFLQLVVPCCWFRALLIRGL